MLCYIGKATKIFFTVVAVLAVAGIVLGLSVFRHGLQRASRKCEGSACPAAGGSRPTYPDPMPAAAAAAVAPPALLTSSNGTAESTAPLSLLSPPALPASPEIPASPPSPVTPSSAASPPIPGPPAATSAAMPPVPAAPTISDAAAGAPPAASSPTGVGIAAAQVPGPFLAHNSGNS